MAKASHTSIEHNPKSPIVSSQALGWDPILVEEFQQPPGGIELQSGADPTIGHYVAGYWRFLRHGT
jgi:AraC family transcriptional regulator